MGQRATARNKIIIVAIVLAATVSLGALVGWWVNDSIPDADSRPRYVTGGSFVIGDATVMWDRTHIYWQHYYGLTFVRRVTIRYQVFRDGQCVESIDGTRLGIPDDVEGTKAALDEYCIGEIVHGMSPPVVRP